jgi:hypothetical protein
VISLPVSPDGAPVTRIDKPPVDTSAAAHSRPEIVLRVLGLIVGVALAIAASIWTAVLTPLYIASMRSPLAVIVALVGTSALTYGTWVVTRRVGLSLLPGLAWVVVMFFALTKTSEGDLIVTGTWVGGLTFLCGCLGWAGTGYYLIMVRRLPARRATPTGPPAPPSGAPRSTVPARPAKAGKASGASGGKASRASGPDASAAEAKAPEAKAPEAKAPEAKAPEAKVSRGKQAGSAKRPGSSRSNAS